VLHLLIAVSSLLNRT